MKHLLALSALVILAGYAVIDIARFAGLPLPAVLNPGTAFLAFLLVSMALIASIDYAPRRVIALPARRQPMAAPRPHSVAAAQRHVYAIRRGVEAARLAPTPARVYVFPRRTCADRHSRAA